MEKTFHKPIAYHLIFWITYFVFNVVRWGSYFGDYLYSFKSNLIEFPLHILITYFTIYYLIPKFIAKRQYGKFFISFGLSLLVIYWIRTVLNYFLVSKNIWPEATGLQEPFTFNHMIAVILGEIYVVALVTSIKLTFDWLKERKRNTELTKIQHETELNFLKTQIQPHFFFNTLNNLYALVIEKSDNAPDVVLKLSEIMQYVLYEVKEPKISLFKEINYIHSYLELEKLRYGDRINSDLNIIGDIEDIEVPPLLFLPFIENCFKHGTSGSDAIIINILFEVKGNFLYFTIENTFDSNLKKKFNHGIGIQNVSRRLKLLYPKKSDLKINTRNNLFTVKLKLPIS